MIAGTLSRYFGMRFVTSVVGSFLGVIALAAMIDYVELMRRGADWPNATAWLLAKSRYTAFPSSLNGSCRSRCWSARCPAT